MKKVLPSIIHYGQTAYFKGRYIGESLTLICDLLKFTEEENLDGILFTVDIENAFDSVDHNYIFASLKEFSFGDNFIQWVTTIFEDSESCVMKNGTSTERGTRQGDPLSPYLFCLLKPYSLKSEVTPQ